MYCTEAGLWLLCLFVGLQSKLKINVYRLCHQQNVVISISYRCTDREEEVREGVDAKDGREQMI